MNFKPTAYIEHVETIVTDGYPSESKCVIPLTVTKDTTISELMDKAEALYKPKIVIQFEVDKHGYRVVDKEWLDSMPPMFEMVLGYLWRNPNGVYYVKTREAMPEIDRLAKQFGWGYFSFHECISSGMCEKYQAFFTDHSVGNTMLKTPIPVALEGWLREHYGERGAVK